MGLLIASWTIALVTFVDCQGHQIGGFIPAQAVLKNHEIVVSPPKQPQKACGWNVWFINGEIGDAMLHGPQLPVPKELKAP